ELGIRVNLVRGMKLCGFLFRGRMNLERGLRGQPHASSLLDDDQLLEAIASEETGRRRSEDHVHAVAFREPSSYAKRRLGVRMHEHRSAPAACEHELQARLAADLRRVARVG